MGATTSASVFDLGHEQADQACANGDPVSLLRAAADHFGDGLVLTTAFGMEGSVLVDMVARHGVGARIVTLDTGLFFEQTYATWRRLESRYGLRIEAIEPELTLEEQAETHGSELWKRAPDACCGIRKVEPLRRVLAPARAWVTGIRRAQTPERANAPRIGWDERFAVTKLNPLATWSTQDVRDYLRRHDVPYNPMFDDGYPSIGCFPCTRRVDSGEDARAGRWSGHEKRECGLHWDVGGGAAPLVTRIGAAG